MIQEALYDHEIGSTRVGATMPRLGLFDKPHMDYFAGWGGATLGFELATGRTVDFCVNHCATAIKFHSINHPHARHFISDVNEIDPDIVLAVQACSAWFSPDCRHFSPARGSAPVSKKVRSLAWVVVKVARAKKRPDVLFVENVPAFLKWGPIRQARHPNGAMRKDPKGRPWMVPIQDREGETFRKWVRALQRAGYVVAWKVIDAADLGVPQHRKRLFIIARCDGRAIVWPERTHCDPEDVKRLNLKPYRMAAECIDWSLPCPSIFMGKREARAFKRATGIQVQRPLATNTLKRTARGVLKFTLESADPFIVETNHGPSSATDFRVRGVDQPMRTVSGAHGQAVVTPSVINIERPQNRFMGGAIDAPLGTITGSPKGGKHAIIAPCIATIGYGERPGQAPRVRPVTEPMNAVVGNGGKSGIVEPVLIGMGGSGYAGKPRRASRPAGVVKCDDRRGVVTPFVAQFNNHRGGIVNLGRDARDPCSTVVSNGTRQAVVSPVVIPCGGPKRQPTSPAEPFHTVLGREDSAVAAATLVKFRGESSGQRIDRPAPTVTSGSGAARPAGAPHALGVSQAFLVKFRGTSAHGATIDQPAPSIGSGGQHESIAAVSLVRMNYGDKQWNAVTEPLSTITGAVTKAVTYAVLMRYHGSGGQWSDPAAPCTTVTAMEGKALTTARCEQASGESLWEMGTLNRAMRVARFMLRYAGAKVRKHLAPVLIETAEGLQRIGDVVLVGVKGIMHVMVDIGLRMFKPRELARCQSFPDSYVLPANTSTAVKLIGNSVPPEVVAALVRSNLPELCTALRRRRSA